ncbi:MAG: TRAM domain-containing protein [Candidatus Saccharibacteria bacterium]|nr:TRAM domain-containing protein [Candidatus Saccharibacteria bacterium]
MEVINLVITVLIFAETTFLFFKKYRPLASGKRKIYVDTSVLIDGRILGVARSGFLDGDLIILKSVLVELQLLADGKDAAKRSRARNGLTVAAELERVINVNVEIVDDGDEHKKVDDELLKHAKETRGAILTIDYNLIKVADVEKIETLNINDLALAMKSDFKSGEKVRLTITDLGSNHGQGVGHLNDGTMVVVERAAKKIGKEVMVELTRIHETASGKMIFAKLVNSKE